MRVYYDEAMAGVGCRNWSRAWEIARVSGRFTLGHCAG